MDMYEYIFVETALGGFFSSPQHREMINDYAEQGWRLVQVLPFAYNSHGKPTEYEIIFERQIEEKELK